MHVIKKDSRYMLFDNETFCLYRLNKIQGEKLYAVGDELVGELCQKISANKSLEPPRSGDVFTSRHASRLVLVISQICNLRCKYCYAQQGTYGQKSYPLMSFDTLKASVLKTLDLYPNGIDKIQFFGGEPLLNFELIKQSVPWIEQQFVSRNLVIPMFCMVTNGILFTQEVHNFCNEHHLNVTISLDGNKEINDGNRVLAFGLGSTYDAVHKSMEIVSRNRTYDLMIEMTLTKSNIRQFNKTGELTDVQDIMSFSPDTLHVVPVICSPEKDADFIWSQADYQSIRQYFAALTELSVTTALTSHPVNVMQVANIGSLLLNRQKKTYLCGAGIFELSVSSNGDVYPCFAFIGSAEMLMGNVHNDSNLQEDSRFQSVRSRLLSNAYSNIPSCKECWLKGLCSNCIGNAYEINGSISNPLEVICEAQRSMFETALMGCGETLGLLS